MDQKFCSDGTCQLKNSPSEKEMKDTTKLQSFVPGVRHQIYEGIIQIFGDIKMAKIPCPNATLSMYGAQVPCMCAEKRFIFAIALIDNNSYGSIVPLSCINWISLQTRTSMIEYNVPVATYEYKSTVFGDTPIFMNRENKTDTYYRPKKYPIEIQLIQTQSGRGYAEEGTILAALETYNTIVYFI
jgi:hypothetical protein